MSQRKLPDIPEERPSEEPIKKIPRILPVSREEYDSRRRYAGDKTEYSLSSVFSVNLEDDDEEEEEEEKVSQKAPPKQETVQNNSLTIFDFLMMIPVFFTSVSWVWHLTLQEVHPNLHSIIDFVLIIYYLISVLFFSSKEKLDDAQILLMVACDILEIALLGIYGDMSHIYLQCMFSIPLSLAIWLVFALMVAGETERGAFTSIFGQCFWFGAVMFLLWKGVENFRWIGFCQLTGIFMTTLLPVFSSGKITKKDGFFMLISVIAMFAVIFGFGR